MSSERNDYTVRIEGLTVEGGSAFDAGLAGEVAGAVEASLLEAAVLPRSVGSAVALAVGQAVQDSAYDRG